MNQLTPFNINFDKLINTMRLNVINTLLISIFSIECIQLITLLNNYLIIKINSNFIIYAWAYFPGNCGFTEL